jgi:hypothetical protein
MPIRDGWTSDFDSFPDGDKLPARVRVVRDPIKLDRIPEFLVLKAASRRMEVVELSPATWPSFIMFAGLTSLGHTAKLLWSFEKFDHLLSNMNTVIVQTRDYVLQIKLNEASHLWMTPIAWTDFKAKHISRPSCRVSKRLSIDETKLDQIRADYEEDLI